MKKEIIRACEHTGNLNLKTKKKATIAGMCMTMLNASAEELFVLCIKKMRKY